MQPHTLTSISMLVKPLIGHCTATLSQEPDGQSSCCWVQDDGHYERKNVE